MIGVTRQAVRELRGLLTQTRAESGHALRLALDGRGGISQAIGPARPGDLQFNDDFGLVLSIGAELAQRVDGLVFDWVIRDNQGRTYGTLAFRRPHDDDIGVWAQPDHAAGAEQGQSL